MFALRAGTGLCEIYVDHVSLFCPDLGEEVLCRIQDIFNKTSWDDPTSSYDFNNVGVMLLVCVESCDTANARLDLLNQAFQAFQQGIHLGCPLCMIHKALGIALTGVWSPAYQLVQSALNSALVHSLTCDPSEPPGLVYLPFHVRGVQNNINPTAITQALLCESVSTQVFKLASEVYFNSVFPWFNSQGLKLLTSANLLAPHAPHILMRAGISYLYNRNFEGVLFLSSVFQSDPFSWKAALALYLYYKDTNSLEMAGFFRMLSVKIYKEQRERILVSLGTPEDDSPWIYCDYENISIACEATLNSISTCVLLGGGDWFEVEMEFWRTWIKPGSVVIDVGANVGVYTFSAALRVGSSGKVLAIEPSVKCLACLQETARINNFAWVDIYAGAASDTNGTLNLIAGATSELNTVTTSDPNEFSSDRVSAVPCSTLDSLISQKGLTNIDFLKIDAEGHEMSVLRGSQQILNQYRPIILYENVDGIHSRNDAVYEYLKARDYDMFFYRPYIRDFVFIRTATDLNHRLNIVAFPKEKCRDSIFRRT